MLGGAITEAVERLSAHRDRPRHLLLAVSGGPDSLALLLAASSLQAADPHAPSISVATVDHGLRPEAAGEACFVAALCAGLRLPHRTLRWRAGHLSGNLQAAAREARYGLLANEARRLGASAVLTAHHRDDQIETHLLARLRGGRGAILAGMRVWRDLAPGSCVLRPFLSLRKSELGEVVRRAGIRPVEDPGNRDLRYRRALVRFELANERHDVQAILRQIEAAEGERRDADLETAREITASIEGSAMEVGRGGEVALMGSAHETAGSTLASRIVTAVGGGPYPPPVAKIEELRRRLNDGGRTISTLGGCRIEHDGSALRVQREFGRRGPSAAKVSPDGEPVVFDRRFDVGLPPACAMVTRIEAFGHLGRGNALERTLPVGLDAQGDLWAVHPALASKCPHMPRLDARPRIGWRIWANLPGRAPDGLTPRLQIAANPPEPVGKDLEATYLR